MIYMPSFIKLRSDVKNLLGDLHDGYKLFTTFQTYINHEVLEILGNRLQCSKEPLKNVLTDCPADSGAAETYTAGECKTAVSSPAKHNICIVAVGHKTSYSYVKMLPSGTRRSNNSFKRQVVSCTRRV
jgi:hypothetical protein